LVDASTLGFQAPGRGAGCRGRDRRIRPGSIRRRCGLWVEWEADCRGRARARDRRRDARELGQAGAHRRRRARDNPRRRHSALGGIAPTSTRGVA